MIYVDTISLRIDSNFFFKLHSFGCSFESKKRGKREEKEKCGERYDLERFGKLAWIEDNFLVRGITYATPSPEIWDYYLVAKEFETAAAPSESHTHTFSMAPFPWPIAIKFSLTRDVIEMLNFTGEGGGLDFLRIDLPICVKFVIGLILEFFFWIIFFLRNFRKI